MTKQEQFLWIVQMVMIQNTICLATDEDRLEKYRHVASGTGAFMTADEAVRASGMIPKDMSAADAANEFCFYMIQNLRHSDEIDGERKEVPYWFARH